MHSFIVCLQIFWELYIFTNPQDSLKFLRNNTKEYVPTVNSNLTCSLMRILDCFFAPFVPKEVCTKFTQLFRYAQGPLLP